MEKIDDAYAGTLKTPSSPGLFGRPNFLLGKNKMGRPHEAGDDDIGECDDIQKITAQFRCRSIAVYE
jgi:hypothetical protein